MRFNKGIIILKNIIFLCITFVILYIAYQFYQENNFNDFIKSESELHTSEFKRDEKIKYGETRSYRIKSESFNDAMFLKKINVKKNTPYKVSCMIKTEQVETEVKQSGVGAGISIVNTTESSVPITGTNDWQKIEFIFNSKNRESVEIAFRLGGALGKAKGQVWFSDFKIEEGITNQDSNWKFACIILKNTKVNVNEELIDINVSQTEVGDIKETIKRFEKSVKELSINKMTAECDIYETDEPITDLSYDEQYGYYVSPENIEEQIKSVIQNKDYDYIFAIVKLGDENHEDDIEINDWIGLGSMDYYGIGYSNIRLPNDSKSYVYKYDTKVNQFPEEVFLHEFLHTLERNANEYGYTIPALHDYEKYGYQNERLLGQKKWYTDYMNKNINSEQGKIGLPEEIYNMKPAKESDFEYSYTIDEFKEPQNIIEEIRMIFKNIMRNLNLIKEN